MKDTGCSGNLALPPELAAELELPFVIRSRSALADGTVVAFNVHSATVVRDGRPRYIDIDAVGVAPLLGMDLMDSHSLYVEITDGGRVHHRTDGVNRSTVLNPVNLLSMLVDAGASRPAGGLPRPVSPLPRLSGGWYTPTMDRSRWWCGPRPRMWASLS